MRLVQLQLGLLAAGLTFVLGCGGTGNGSVSPVGPSSSRGNGATIAGQIISPGTPITARSLDITLSPLDARGITITVVGTGISTSADNRGQFTLIDVPAGNVQLNFTGPGSNATVTISGVQPNDRVQITVTVNGNSARVDSEHHSSKDNGGTLEGQIRSIDSGAQSLVVSGTTIKVPASAVIRRGSQTLQFSALKVGDHVEVRGTRDGGTITATEIKVGDADDDDDVDEDNNNNNRMIEREGTVSNLGGSCPGVTFTVHSTKISATSSTSYEDESCASLKNGIKVEVKGTRQADGSITATRIEIG